MRSISGLFCKSSPNALTFCDPAEDLSLQVFIEIGEREIAAHYQVKRSVGHLDANVLALKFDLGGELRPQFVLLTAANKGRLQPVDGNESFRRAGRHTSLLRNEDERRGRQ